MSVPASLQFGVGKMAWAALLDAVFPPHCAGCSEWCREPFCRFCLPKLKAISAPLCEKCGIPFDPLSFPASICSRCRARQPHFLAARAGFDFEGPVREAIHDLKYHEKTALAPRLAPFLAATLRDDPVLRDLNPDFIMAVPLHRRRLKSRGYNQSFLLARELGLILELPLVDVVERIRDTPPQVKLKREDRAKNIRDAFQVDLGAFQKIGGKSRRFLLVDDVLTTGATLDEITRVLRKAGAGEVGAVTLARVR
ncbi:ComF family protein [bacterium]|nr:MAG: ComF family protein [bacterium]